MLQFLVDTQLPPRLASLLTSFGYDAIHTTFFPNGHLLSDRAIIQIAIAEQRIIVSKDSDFLDNFLLRGVPPQVLLLQFGNISNTDLALLFNANREVIDNFFIAGSGLVRFDRQSITAF
ncbi:MAG: DUF5615 family PIN-like protein [Saprospiraceae bacterium]